MAKRKSLISNNEEVYDPQYFASNYDHIRYPITIGNKLGLRRCQIGASHALTAHLTMNKSPGIVVMPTGAGKTAVLIACPFIHRAKRVLILTPGKQLREQIVDDFSHLSVLRKIGVVGGEVSNPLVHELTHKVTSIEKWKELEPFNVVVSTPNTISPAMVDVVPPPEDFFDLILVDEAHHSPAKTWNAVLEAFPNAHKALFTATPFRRDGKEIKGSIVFRYSLKEARKENVFGAISFVPVVPIGDEDPDVAIAKKVEEAFREDQEKGLKHSALIRSDSNVRAGELLKIYESETNLKLALINSDHTAKHVRRTIEKLKSRELDGVVCVNMLGEGFDFPNLKIAGLHTPHKSLGVTLQFIGRFARTGDEDLGAARFFAVPQEIEGETQKLFQDDQEGWEDLVVGLAESRSENEEKIREDLKTFAEPEIEAPSLKDLSLYSLKPNYHVKIYKVPKGTDVSNLLNLPKPMEVGYWAYSQDLSAGVAITIERKKPKWAVQVRFSHLHYELFVIYHDLKSDLLFIAASRKGSGIFRHIGAHYAGKSAKILPLYKINRVLSGLTKVKCHNIGMRCRLKSSRAETYRIKSGSNTGPTVQKIDGKLFHRGHVVCTALIGNEPINIGYSSGSKVWSGNNGTIPSLIGWCKSLAKKITTEVKSVPIEGLEHLTVGEQLKEIPSNVLSVDWDSEVYLDDIEVAFKDSTGKATEKLLLDLDIQIYRNDITKDHISVTIGFDEQNWTFLFTPLGDSFFNFVSGTSGEPVVDYDSDEMPLSSFLNEYPLSFYFADFALLRGEEWFPCDHKAESFDKGKIEALDWSSNCDIQKEYWKEDDTPVGLSIHQYLKEILVNEKDTKVVFYDHRSGEVADFLALSVQGKEVTIRLYHCKGSGESKPGDRVGDVYDVCGQVVKSFNLMGNVQELIRHVKHRSKKGKILSVFEKGDITTLESLLSQDGSKLLSFELVVVQPGISVGKISEDCLNVLGAADEFIRQLGVKKLKVLGSK